MIRHEQRPRRKRNPDVLVEPDPPLLDASAPADEPPAAPAEDGPAPAEEEDAAPPAAPRTPLLNRELSWLDFNQRVLEEARDERWPLLERLKFLCISESNLDEFFMIRVSGLREQLSADLAERSDDGLSAREQLMLDPEGRPGDGGGADGLPPRGPPPAARGRGHLRPLLGRPRRSEREEAARSYFRRNVLPVLTPLAVDPGHPFPFLSNLSLNLAIEVRNPETGEVKFARVKMPPAIPRLLSLREIVEGKKKVAARAEFLLLESLVQANLDELFPGLEILASHLFRITRDADIEIQEDEASDLLATIEQEVRRRRFGAVVRVEVAPKTPKRIRKLLMRQLEVSEADIYEVDGILGAADLMAL